MTSEESLQQITVKITARHVLLLRRFAENLQTTEDDVMRRALERYFGED